MATWLRKCEEFPPVAGLDRACARIGRWRVGAVAWILVCVILWLPWRHAEGGIAFPQLAALVAFVLAHALALLFVLDLLFRQAFNLGHRRDAAVSAFELLFLLCLALAWVLPWWIEYGSWLRVG